MITGGHKFRQDHSLGQHFLIDKNVLQKIVTAGALTPQDCVLEIGAGQGVLTEELVKSAQQVLSFEIDKRLIEGLREKFSDSKNIKIINEDVLKFDIGDLSKILNLKSPILNYKVVANIPYNITSKLLEKFLTAANKPQLMVLLVQKEMAERICSSSGDKSLLSIMVQYFGEPQILQIVKPASFNPPPQVESAILKILVIPPRLPQEEEKFFFKIVKIGFSQKRKMLKKNLKAIFPEDLIKTAFVAAKLSLEVRAEDLDISEWLKLAKLFMSFPTSYQVRGRL